jgi:iron complex outermembrane receptor protein
MRVNLGALWKVGKWSVNLREAFYGKSSGLDSSDGSAYYKNEVSPAWITDLELSYQLTKAWSMSIGANNLFNKYPDQVNATLLAERRANLDNGAVTIYPTFSPFGINGGYYYARAAMRF